MESPAIKKTYARKGTNQQSQVELHEQIGNEVFFFPRGGGFRSRMPADKFFEEFEEVTVEDKYVARLAHVEIMTSAYPAYVKPMDRWNGWAKPFFTKEAMFALMKEMDFIKYSYETGSFFWQDTNEYPAELVEEAPMQINVDGEGPVTVFGLGTGAWCWDAYEPGAKLPDGVEVATLEEIPERGAFRTYEVRLLCTDAADILVPAYVPIDEFWNGNAVPAFTKEGADCLVEHYSGLTYNEERDRYEFLDPAYTDEIDANYFEPHFIDVKEKGIVRVYSIGAYFWSWEAYEKTDPELPQHPVLEIQL